MKKDKLNEYVGKFVKVTLFDFVRDDNELIGKLMYIPEFSEKYGWRRPNYYAIGDFDFKASHVKSVKDL